MESTEVTVITIKTVFIISPWVYPGPHDWKSHILVLY